MSIIGTSGFSLLMFVGTIWVLTRNQPLRKINRPIAAVAVLLLLLSTAVSLIATYIDMIRSCLPAHDRRHGPYRKWICQVS